MLPSRVDIDSSWSCYDEGHELSSDVRVYTITCICLQNYTLVHMNMAARQKSVLKIKDRLKQVRVVFFATYCKIK